MTMDVAPMPPSTRRLFDGVADDDLSRSACVPFIIGRLLEDGDGDDLRWLSDWLGEADLVDWLAQRGSRQLSRRSAAFWSAVLAVDVEPHNDALWST